MSLRSGARVGDALVGIAMVSLNRAELDRTAELAAELVALGRRTGDETYLICGYSLRGMADFYQGRFALALEHCEQATALYDPRRHATLALQYGADPGAAAHARAAWALWSLGFPDRARCRARETVLLARSLALPFTISMTLQWQTMLHWLLGDVEAQRELAEELAALSESEGLPFFLGIARAFRGAALAASGNGQGGMKDLTEGLALMAGTGNQLGTPALLALLAETQASAGQHAEALATLKGALAVSAQTRQPFFDAELLRLQGEMLVESRAADAAEAEHCVRQALTIARSQGAKSVELRAATSLARLWRDRGRRAEAHALLAPVYAWFSEGFGTRDLLKAKALLEGLG